jgi:perosamine synthetase
MKNPEAQSSQHKQKIIDQLLYGVKKVLGNGPVTLHEPSFQGKEWEYVKDCIDSTFVSSVGNYVNDFERKLSNYTGAKYAVAVVNGSSALHLALKVCGIQPGEEVLIPSLTFVATANAVIYCGAIPHFVDSDEKNLGISPDFLREYLKKISVTKDGICINKHTNNPIRALLPMHVFGHPVDLDSLLAITHDFNLVLVEDAAESLGSFYHGQHTGTFGAAGVLSFNGNKTITTGGGGAILTNDKQIALKAKHLSTNAKQPHPWNYIHNEVGYNYRMPNINAALGCAQIEQLDIFRDSKRNLFKAYKTVLSDIPEISLIEEPLGADSNYWLQAIMLQSTDLSFRDNILEAMNNAGYMARPVWSLLHKFKHFECCPRSDLSQAEALEQKIINIPSSSNIMG